MLENIVVSASGEGFYNYGIYNDNASPTLTNVTFSENSATVGGALYNNNTSAATLTN